MIGGYIKIVLDDYEVQDEPQGVRKFIQSIIRDKEKRITYISYPNTVIFWGDGYDYITTQLNQQGYIDEIEVTVYKTCGGVEQEEINGLIKLTDVVLDLDKCECKVRILDNSYSSRIDNNRTISVSADTPKSKNDESITAATGIELTLYNPSNATDNSGFSTSGTRTVYDVMEILEHMIQFMSDGEIGLVSTWYDNLPDNERIAVCTGKELRTRSDDAPDVSYDEMYIDLAKYFNLWSTIEISGTTINLRIEQEGYFFGLNNSVQVDNVADVERGFYPDKLYTGVKFGGADVADPVLTFPNPAFEGFRKEEYYFTGQNNVRDNDLDLLTSVIVDSNVIEDVLLNNNDEYDDELFLIQYDRSTNKATRCDILQVPGSSARYYNGQLTNAKTSERYNAQGDVAKFFGDGNDTFRAAMVASQPQINQITYIFPKVYQDDTTPPNNDPNNNFQITNTPAGFPVLGSVPASTYICPVSGVYTFETAAAFRLTLTGLWPGGTPNPWSNNMGIAMFRYSAAGGFIERKDVMSFVSQYVTLNPAPAGTYNVNGTQTFYLNATDRVYFIVTADIEDGAASSGLAVADVTIVDNDNTTYAECIATSNTGGLYQSKDAGAYKISRDKFEEYLTNDQRRTLLNDPARYVGYNRGDGVPLRGWPNKIDVNLYDGHTDFELITEIQQ